MGGKYLWPGLLGGGCLGGSGLCCVQAAHFCISQEVWLCSLRGHLACESARQGGLLWGAFEQRKLPGAISLLMGVEQQGGAGLVMGGAPPRGSCCRTSSVTALQRCRNPWDGPAPMYHVLWPAECPGTQPELVEGRRHPPGMLVIPWGAQCIVPTKQR